MDYLLATGTLASRSDEGCADERLLQTRKELSKACEGHANCMATLGLGRRSVKDDGLVQLTLCRIGIRGQALGVDHQAMAQSVQHRLRSSNSLNT